MAVKTFSTGEVLTASDTNTYLANAGLVYITEAVATSGTFLYVNSCFTSTYQSYVLYVTGAPTASAYGIDLRMRASSTDTTTGYYWGVTGLDMGTGAALTTRGSNFATFATYSIAGTSGRSAAVIQVINPQLAQYTNFMCQSTDSRGAAAYQAITATGQLLNNTQYDGFSLSFGAGGGTISYLGVKVYGVRQA